MSNNHCSTSLSYTSFIALRFTLGYKCSKQTMAPSIHLNKTTLNNYTSSPSPLPSPSSSLADSSGTITNVVFGLLTVIIGIVTVWQAQRAYCIWARHHVLRASNASKIFSQGRDRICLGEIDTLVQLQACSCRLCQIFLASIPMTVPIVTLRHQSKRILNDHEEGTSTMIASLRQESFPIPAHYHWLSM